MKETIHTLRRAGITWTALAGAIATASITLLSALTLTIVSAWLITRAAQMPPVLELSVAITAVRGLGISRAVFRYTDRMVSHRLVLTIQSTLRVTTFNDIVTSHNSPELAHSAENDLLADTETITEYIARTLVPAGAAATLSLIAIAFAFWLHPLAGLALTAAMAITGILIPTIAAHATRKAHLITADSTLRTTIATLLNHRVELTTLGRLRPATTDVTTAATKRTTALATHERPLALASGLTTLTEGLTALSFLGIGILAYTHINEPTWLGMMILLPLAAFESHHALPEAFSHPTQRILAMTRKSASETAPVTPPGNSAPEITITGTAVGDSPAVSVRNLVPRPGGPAWNLDVGFGQCAVIKAPSGYGKTSLLEAIAGALTPAAGTVSLARGDDTPRRRLVRLHEEDEWIFGTTVRENLVIANPDRNDYEEVCEAVGFPLPLDTVLADGANSLSSGQRRRLILARALLAPTPIVLLDEPTEHIDPVDATRLLEMFRYPPEDKAVIIVTHAEDLAPDLGE